MHRFAAILVLLALAACSSSSKPAPVRDEPVLAPDATPAPAPVTWRGPNLYTLVDGGLTVAISLKPPGGWKEDATDEHELVTSPAGSTLEVTLDKGHAMATPTQTTRASHHEHAVATAAGEWVLSCDVVLVAADMPLFGNLSKQCAELSFQRSPDERAGWKVEVEPATVKLADVAMVTIRYHVTNLAREPIDAKAYSLEWQIDGVASFELANGFGNGGFESKWLKLPPGDTVHDQRNGFELVQSAGDHVISLSHLGHEVGRAMLHVQ